MDVAPSTDKHSMAQGYLVPKQNIDISMDLKSGDTVNLCQIQAEHLDRGSYG